MKNHTEVCWELMQPWQLRESIAELPVAYVPLGLVEWHGEHCALGLDAIKAHEICKRAAQISGGVVYPTIYGGMGAVDLIGSIPIEDDNSPEQVLLRPWTERVCYQLYKQGIRGIILLTGHYSTAQQITIRELASRLTMRMNIPVYGSAEHTLGFDVGYEGDHAGIGETSILLHLFPHLVDMDRLILSDAGQVEINDNASAELGEKYVSTIVRRLSNLAKHMPHMALNECEDMSLAEQLKINAIWTQRDEKHAEYAKLFEAFDWKGMQKLASK